MDTVLQAEILPGDDLPEPYQPEPSCDKAPSHQTLDPDNWEEFRQSAHQALDEMITNLAAVDSGPVWQTLPTAVREKFSTPLPRAPRDLDDVLTDYRTDIEPYVTGNRHPLFMGWVHGAGTPVGMIAEMLAAGLNANCGGRDHVGLDVERQITRWLAELFGFPKDASGIFVTGTSMANFLGLLVARTKALGIDVRAEGLRASPKQLTAYTSEAAHACIAQALELSGIGSGNLRLIPPDKSGGMCPHQLEAAIALDQDAGHQPFLIVGTAGTVNTGEIDPLDLLADIAQRHQLWFHIDGAYGALAALSPNLRPRLTGIERADSIAFDFHKWAHVPYDAGFLLVRDAEAHKRTFASPAAYLQRASRGLAAGDTWPCDLGPDLSRGFRALKTWFTFQTLGADKIGTCIEQCCDVASYLESRLRTNPLFEVVAPAKLNIVCWRLTGSNHDSLNEEIVMDLHQRGLAVPSMTTIAGRPAIRAAIVNHRTSNDHIDSFMDSLTAITREHLKCQGQE